MRCTALRSEEGKVREGDCFRMTVKKLEVWAKFSVFGDRIVTKM